MKRHLALKSEQMGDLTTEDLAMVGGGANTLPYVTGPYCVPATWEVCAAIEGAVNDALYTTTCLC